MLSDSELMKQSMMTANDYMNHAIIDIDKRCGDGYALVHPELIAAYMKTAAIDFATAAGLRKISSAIDDLAESIDLNRVES